MTRIDEIKAKYVEPWEARPYCEDVQFLLQELAIRDKLIVNLLTSGDNLLDYMYYFFKERDAGNIKSIPRTGMTCVVEDWEYHTNEARANEAREKMEQEKCP